MICIAAFIILGIIVLCVPIIRIFSRKTADKIWAMFKKSLHCFSRRVTLRKCDTSFKDDIKNSILRKVVLKHPKRVKLISGLIEAGAVLIVVVSIWSLLVALRSLTFLYVYDTCDPADPKSCTLSSSAAVKACPIGVNTSLDFFKDPIGWTGDWFGQWGTAISEIPDRVKKWDATEYLPNKTDLNSTENAFYNKHDTNKPVALDIFEPGCTYCRMEFSQQQQTGFFDKNNVAIITYVKPGDKNGHEFENSYIIASYLEAVREIPLSDSELSAKNESHPAVWLLVSRLFTEKDPETDSYWQDTFGSLYSNTYGSYGRLFTQDQARAELKKWLVDFGYSGDEISKITTLAESQHIKDVIAKNMKMIDDEIRAQSLPTVIASGRRVSGLQAQQ